MIYERRSVNALRLFGFLITNNIFLLIEDFFSENFIIYYLKPRNLSGNGPIWSFWVAKGKSDGLLSDGFKAILESIANILFNTTVL